jgi:ParB/RepB/Spo0J family partition protein
MMATPGMQQYSDVPPEYVNAVPIDHVRESSTNPRKHFDKAKLEELAKSVAEKGILVPLIVRRAGDTATSQGLFEIVAGARRFRAAQLAGLETVRVLIRDLSDDQVLEIQVIENLQRSDVHPLEEANGYKQLLAGGKYKDVEALAAKVGKSTSYVYQRLKLADMIEPAQKAFFDEKITAGHAIQVARLKPEQQKEVMKWLKQQDFSVRELARSIEREFHLDLSKAIFPTDDAEMFVNAGACTTCRKRTGANPQLFDDVQKGDTCTDPKCFEEKERGFVKIQLGNHQDAVMLSIGHSYNEAVKGRAASEWVPARGKKCQDTGEGVVVQWEGRSPMYGSQKGLKLGQVLDVCINPLKCKVHAGQSSDDAYRYSGSSSRPKTPAEKKAQQKKQRAWKVDQLIHSRMIEELRQNPAEVGVAELRSAVYEIMQQYQFKYRALLLARAFGLSPEGKTPSQKNSHAEELLEKRMKTANEDDCMAFIAGWALTPTADTDDEGREGMRAAATKFGVKIAAIEKSCEVQTSAPKKGTCRFCGCTEKKACKVRTIPGSKQTQPCSWIDATKTICSNPECVAKAKKAAA